MRKLIAAAALAASALLAGTAAASAHSHPAGHGAAGHVQAEHRPGINALGCGRLFNLHPTGNTQLGVTQHGLGAQTSIDNNANSTVWFACFVGNVSNATAWPFTPGSGMNAAANGDFVWEFVHSGGNCLNDFISSQADFADLWACGNDSNNHNWWVQHGATNPTLLNVGGSNASGHFSGLSDLCLTSGCRNWVEPVPSPTYHFDWVQNWN